MIFLLLTLLQTTRALDGSPALQIYNGIQCPSNMRWGAPSYPSVCFMYNIAEDVEDGDFYWTPCNVWCTRNVNAPKRSQCGQNLCSTVQQNTPSPTRATTQPTSKLPTTASPTPTPEPEGNCPKSHPFLGTYAAFGGNICWKSGTFKSGSQLESCTEWCTLDQLIGSEPQNQCALKKQLCRTSEPTHSPTAVPTKSPSDSPTASPPTSDPRNTTTTSAQPTPPTTTTRRQCDPWYKMFGSNCGQFCLGRQIGACGTREVTRIETIQKGECGRVGFGSELSLGKASFEYKLPNCDVVLEIKMYYKQIQVTPEPCPNASHQPECPTCPSSSPNSSNSPTSSTTFSPTPLGFTNAPSFAETALPTKSPSVFRLKNTHFPERPKQKCPYCPCAQKTSSSKLAISLTIVLTFILLI